MPPRFFCHPLPGTALSEARCTLGPDESRHARKVLRLSEGDRVELFDGAGQLADAEIEGFVSGAAVCRVTAQRRVEPTGLRLTVASAVPKGSRAEDMVNQLGQLGVDEFVPMRCARSVAEPSDGKLERYEKAALASAKQSGRPTMMRIGAVMDFADVLAWTANRGDAGLILDPGGGELPASLNHPQSEAARVVVLVGPEGGWTAEELTQAEQSGFASWRIAQDVLRIETAAAAAASVLRYLGMPRGSA